MFQPIRTERLLLRAARRDDIEPLWRRRNDPRVHALMDWEMPYTLERATQLVEAVMEMDGPENEEWWLAVVADPETEEMLGTVAVHLTWEGRTAEIGYEMEPDQWGKGYANEATEAMATYLFETKGITRLFGQLHPDNRASAMVLERMGMLFEGHTRSSFWVGDENSDDWIYGMTRDDWEAWRNRPRTAPDDVRLVEITDANLRPVLALATHKSQESFVAPVVRSLAQAAVPPTGKDGTPLVPWFRAIEADGVPAGFVMVALGSDRTRPYLWRLLVDRMHQRRGIASRALEFVEDEMRALGGERMFVSWVDGKGSPAAFYEARGYERTGEVHGGEAEARKVL